MEVSKSIFKRQADFLEKNGKYLLQFTTELIYVEKFDSIEKAKNAIFEYIEMYYNTKRLHSSLGYLSPIQFEIKNC